jgi:uncharacterized protein (DUF433 family)
MIRSTTCRGSRSRNTSGVDPHGAYTADRAAALAGVPLSTLHYWTRREYIVPSVSPVRVKLWSYADLLGLRTIAWLRATKTDDDGATIPRTTMPVVRHALRELDALDLDLWTDETIPNVAIDRSGHIVLEPERAPRTLDGQHLIDADEFDVLRPFDLGANAGPDLVKPRPRLRILPGKLAGAPHVHDTRVETQALAALRVRGLDTPKIGRLYPILEHEDIEDALDLERQLQPTLALAA